MLGRALQARQQNIPIRQAAAVSDQSIPEGQINQVNGVSSDQQGLPQNAQRASGRVDFLDGADQCVEDSNATGVILTGARLGGDSDHLTEVELRGIAAFSINLDRRRRVKVNFLTVDADTGKTGNNTNET